MKNLATLGREARKSCKARGHKMTPFVMLTFHTEVSHCLTCGKEAIINDKPMPNDIDIAGEAVALNCTDAETVMVNLVRYMTTGKVHADINKNPYNVPVIKEALKFLAAQHGWNEWMDAADILYNRKNPII